MATKRPGFKVRTFVVCDEIRKEESQKNILIGVYNRDIIVGSLPAILPILSFFILLEMDVGGEIGFEMRGPDRKAIAQVSADASNINTGEWVQAPFGFRNARLEREGRHTVRLSLDGVTRTAGEFFVKLRKAEEEKRPLNKN